MPSASGLSEASGFPPKVNAMTATVGVSSTHPKTMPADHAEIPVWNSENWFYEDFEVGHKIRSLRRTISEGESQQFNALVLDMHPYVSDQIFAETEGLFGKRLVAGAFVFPLAWDLSPPTASMPFPMATTSCASSSPPSSATRSTPSAPISISSRNMPSSA